MNVDGSDDAAYILPPVSTCMVDSPHISKTHPLPPPLRQKDSATLYFLLDKCDDGIIKEAEKDAELAQSGYAAINTLLKEDVRLSIRMYKKVVRGKLLGRGVPSIPILTFLLHLVATY